MQGDLSCVIKADASPKGPPWFALNPGGCLSLAIAKVWNKAFLKLSATSLTQRMQSLGVAFVCWHLGAFSQFKDRYHIQDIRSISGFGRSEESVCKVGFSCARADYPLEHPNDC